MFVRYRFGEICGYVDVDGLSTVIHFSRFFELSRLEARHLFSFILVRIGVCRAFLWRREP